MKGTNSRTQPIYSRPPVEATAQRIREDEIPEARRRDSRPSNNTVRRGLAYRRDRLTRWRRHMLAPQAYSQSAMAWANEEAMGLRDGF